MRYSISGAKVVEQLEHVAAFRGGSTYVRVDNGSEFYSKDFHQWAAKHGVQIVFIEPGKRSRMRPSSRLTRLFNESFLLCSFLSMKPMRMKKRAGFKPSTTLNDHMAHSALRGPPGEV